MTVRMTDGRLRRIQRGFEQELCLGTDDGREVLAELDRARAEETQLRDALEILQSANARLRASHNRIRDWRRAMLAKFQDFLNEQEEP
jgi:hypothetical protein